MILTRLCLAALLLLLIPNEALSQQSPVEEEKPVNVCAIGDSHVTPGSALIRELQRELGPNYSVVGRGRTGWSSVRWLRVGGFGECQYADIVLVSLGGNDERAGLTELQINSNVKRLISGLPEGIRHYHMTQPRLVNPRLHLGRDGRHLTRRGAREYARILASILIDL